jgi:nucleoside-diphosphate-sugar epimerase
MANYLVTGAAGFIASRVSELLLAAGHTVTGVDNLNDAYDVRIKEFRLNRLLARPGFTFLRLDISQREAIDRLAAAGSFAAVINLAARAGVRQSVENPWVYVDTNITGTLNLLELCRMQGIPKFILASTSSIYGENAPLPTPENANSDLPLQVYAASKKGAEALCHVYHYLNGLDVTIFRYFTVYGPAPRPDMVMFRFTQWISEGRPVLLNGDGEQSRGFTYVDDIARGTILGLKPVGYEIINLGGSQVITINQLIRTLEGLIGRKAQVTRLPRHPADMSTNHANVQKAGELLGWEPVVSLEEGIAHLVAWYKAERSWAANIITT